MSRFTAKPPTDFIATARAAWGDPMPDWIEALARKANAGGLGSTARAAGYSGSTLSYVIAGKYAGNLARVETAVRGAFMDATVACPVVGEIGLNRCLEEQKKNFIGSSAIRTKLYHKCRGIGTERCPHSMIGGKGGAK
jgi:hypothetical protein